MTALPNTSDTDNNVDLEFRLVMSDLRRAIDAAPEDERAALFAFGAVEQVAAWSGRIAKIDLVDSLHEIGVVVGLDVITIQDALADAFCTVKSGAAP